VRSNELNEGRLFRHHHGRRDDAAGFADRLERAAASVRGIVSKMGPGDLASGDPSSRDAKTIGETSRTNS
jgi:hypothetical protein